MLKKLELVGFKSFADKTAFVFAAGITAVVGPNGSGKSNVVDAVKWVLGEQSAKSLRGGAMADVIFNGSATRKPFAHAEVTLTFDNVASVLATDATEVRITRRVHRDGQGEYFINGQLCRLKDIKDLFLGTGTGAYSIIEQGRVDALLQSAQDDRRHIFEEAAGISRYKARKVECLRRLERVGQNLERLGDILNSVETQLRSVRAQATKAQKYRELTDRLKALRVGVALGEYRELTARVDEHEGQLARLQAAMAEAERNAAERVARVREAEIELERLDDDLRNVDHALADARTRLAARSAARAAEADGLARLTAEKAAAEQLRLDLVRRQAAVRAEAHRAGLDVAAAEADCDRASAAVEDILREDREQSGALSQLKAEAESFGAAHLDHLRTAARWHNDAVGHKARVDQLRRERERLTSRASQTNGQLNSVTAERDAIARAVREVAAGVESLGREVIDARTRRDALTDEAARRADELARLRTEAARLASRIDVLNDWDHGHEAADAGIRFVYERMAELGGAIVAWVADAVAVSRDDAPLIDVALGPLARSFVVRDWGALLEWLDALPEPLPGRVGFIAVCEPGEGEESPRLPPALVGVTNGVAFVDSAIPGLPERLLGGTFVVDDIATARSLATRAPGYRFVTRRGDLLDADGTLHLGASRVGDGVIARKAELRELRQQQAETARLIADREAGLAVLRDDLAANDDLLAARGRELTALEERHADLTARLARLDDRRANLRQELSLGATELALLDAEIHRGEKAWKADVQRADEAEVAAAAALARQQHAEQAIRRHEAARQARAERSTEAQVALAQQRARLASTRQALAMANESLVEIDAAVARQDENHRGRRLEIVAATLRVLAIQAELAELAAEVERLEGRANELTGRRDAERAALHALHAEGSAGQDAWQKARDEAHALDLKLHDLRHRRDSLAARIGEDYEIDLAALSAGETAPALGPLTPDDAQREADELRQKLHRMGSVNLESLDELAEVEQRYELLRTQFDDLTHARKALEDIIHRINGDSRRLFLDTFAAIRVHFQDLFRRLFGGGMADIVLENPDDPLETNIDIVARPPGKELRSIALMSGGERTMTAVALLLAIFRSKPSPFCLLDEVDAALDEANTARLTAVLREFASTSQFIVITHAKRTMAAADLLYGVTMQESGVSKRVAVRFDDYSDDQRKAA